LPNTNIHISDLIDRCLKGERNAQFELYNRYYRAMYNSAYRIMNNAMEAEDIMQESFLVAFQKLDTFKRKSKYDEEIIPLGSWLKRIVINNSINQLRRNKLFLLTDLKEIKEEINEPIDDEFKDQKVAILLDTLKELKPNYKLALTLFLAEGYDYEEISNIMKISYQNCRTLISRAKVKLRTLLNQKDEYK
jgi:RNA polymerase sigma-70 factor (ECF subfamily)